MHPPLVAALLLTACATEAPVDPCQGEGALATCTAPNQPPETYVAAAEAYFDTMDSRVEDPPWPPYSELVARWEWPPWLKLTAYTRDNIEATDTALRAFPSTVTERDCRAFDTAPFARCRVVFRYEAHDDLPCPIYEEFIFNERGEVTWIEAWSDQPGLLPMDGEADPWAEGKEVSRLGTRIPGLGTPDGRIDLDGEAMTGAAAGDADVADFVRRAEDWQATWLAELEAAGDDLWERGCGW